MRCRDVVVCAMIAGCLSPASRLAAADRPAQVITLHGYPNCIELVNGATRVVLCPEAGGRVLEYSLNGVNALYLEEAETGKPYTPGKGASMSAGRFDIGPENIIPRHEVLWSGRWRGEVLGPRAARLTSQRDKTAGTQLVREFRLDEKGSHLACTQTIRNVSDETTEWCHWSRTFAVGNGICLIPLTEPSRFPNFYVMYEDGNRINLRPEDERIRRREGFLEILDVPRHPKLGMDSAAGWFAYLTPNDLMFVKRFAVDRDRVYNEVAGLTLSVWYPEDRRVELEPIGPRERLRPGESASFTEHWHLIKHSFPTNRREVDLKQVRKAVAEMTAAPQ
jgi:hypothetical protein